MGRSQTESCSLTLPLLVEKWQADKLEKRFEIARQLYNTLLHAELKKLHQVEHTPEYRAIQAKQNELKDQKDSKEYKALSKQRSDFLKRQGLNENSFTGDMKNYYPHFQENIASKVAVLGIAKQVWAAFEKYLYGNGKRLHFKRHGEVNSVAGAANTDKNKDGSYKSGGAEIIFHGDCVTWKKLNLRVKRDTSNQYEQKMLTHRVKYCRLLRKQGRHKVRYYVQLVLEGRPEVKVSEDGTPKHPVGTGRVGLDIGPQTLAYSADSECDLVELADRVQNIEHEKQILQRKMDRSRRATNPDNYAEDGTIRRGVKLSHHKSKRYLKIQKELAYLQHKQADIRKQQHNVLANHLLSLGDQFFVEDMDWRALQHRSKKTEISEKTGKYKSKKRYGKSIANKAPASLITILNNKLVALGLQGVVKVPTNVRASQYNHITGEYIKKERSERWNRMPDGTEIQRDLYSAFLLQHMNKDNNGFDQEALERDYGAFRARHDKAIEMLRARPHRLASMGV